MANKITITANKENSTKDIEYLHPITNKYQNSNVFDFIPRGKFTKFKARLKGSNPEISTEYTKEVNVEDVVQAVLNSGRGYDEGVPIMKLTAPNFANLTKAEKQVVQCEIVNANGSAYSGTQLYSGSVEIKGAGNSTWSQPKKPMNITFPNKLPILGMPGSKKYRLLAGAIDFTLLHSSMSFELGRLFGVTTPESRPILIEVNGEFHGFYDICEKADQKVVDTYGVTDTYVGQKAATHQEDLTTVNWFQTPLYGPNYTSVTPKITDRLIIMEVPEFGKQTQAQYDFFKQLTIDAEASLNIDWSDLTNGPQKYFDKDSTIKYYLISEFAKQYDTESVSSYFHKRPNDNKLYFGSLWDFDVAYMVYDVFAAYTNPTEFFTAGTPWFKKLFQSQSFINDCAQYLIDNASLFDQVMLFAKRRMQLLIDTGIQDSDSKKWNNWNSVWHKPVATGVSTSNYKSHTDLFFNFMMVRLDWMKKTIVKKVINTPVSGSFFLDNSDPAGYFSPPTIANVKTFRMRYNSSYKDTAVVLMSGSGYRLKGSTVGGVTNGAVRLDGIAYTGNIEDTFNGVEHYITFELANTVTFAPGMLAHFKGTIKSIEFFDRNLTDVECTQEFIANGIVAVYRGLFTNDKLVDESGNGYDITPINAIITNKTR